MSPLIAPFENHFGTKAPFSRQVWSGPCSQVNDTSSVALILYRLSVYQLYWPKILVSAIGNITKCILVTKILHFYGQTDRKIVKLCTER